MTLRGALEKVWFAIRPREVCTQFGECDITCPICHQHSAMHVRGGEPNPLTHREDCPIPHLDKFLHATPAPGVYDVVLRTPSMMHMTSAFAGHPLEAIESVLGDWSPNLNLLSVSAELEGQDEKDAEMRKAIEDSGIPWA